MPVDIRGFFPVSLIEYPGKIASVVFTGGCNLRCPFCHNPDLVNPDYAGANGSFSIPKISEEDLLNKINKKKEWIDAVCFTGGEPALNADLPFLFERIKQIRGISADPLLIMLETNGTNPDMISDLISCSLVDYIAMDVKAPFEDYFKLGASPEITDKVKKSAEIICENFNCRDAINRVSTLQTNRVSTIKISTEFRITAAPDIVNLDNIRSIGGQIKGAQKIILQQFRPISVLDEKWKRKEPYPEEILEKMERVLKEFAGEAERR